jgi:hypothetical protein
MGGGLENKHSKVRVQLREQCRVGPFSFSTALVMHSSDTKIIERVISDCSWTLKGLIAGMNGRMASFQRRRDGLIGGARNMSATLSSIDLR